MWAHVKRNLQQMADYSGGGHTVYIGKNLCLLTNAIFHTRHRYEQGELDDSLYLRRMHRLQKLFEHWLSKGTDVMLKRYRGRYKLRLKHRKSLWVFLKKTSPSLPIMKLSDVLEVLSFKGKLASERPRM